MKLITLQTIISALLTMVENINYGGNDDSEYKPYYGDNPEYNIPDECTFYK